MLWLFIKICSNFLLTIVLRNLFEKVKSDIRLMKEEQQNLDRSKQPKERSLAQLKANLEAMQATKEGLESELHQDLLATLSVQVERWEKN